VAFDPVVAAVLVSPVSVDPDGMTARRLNIVAGNPDIAGTVPAVVAVDPNPAFMRDGAGMFDDDGRRANLHIDPLCKCRGEAEECGRSNEEQFLHRSGFFLSGIYFGDGY
jgi:hypothetical protein